MTQNDGAYLCVLSETKGMYKIMKLVLTSGGISNKSIENELKNMIKNDLKDLKMLFCITASNYEGGAMNEWLIKDLEYFKNLGFQIDICDINGIGIEKLLLRFEWADVYFFEGGNTQWLKKNINNSGLEEHLSKLLETRVWIGASAGSCILCPTIDNSFCDIYDDRIEDFLTDGLGYVDFQFVPHFNNKCFPKVTEENIRNASKKLKGIDGKKVYVMDDNGAIFIDNGNIKVVSEGKWFEIDI